MSLKLRILGARERTVSKSKSFTDVETFSGELVLKNSIKSFISYLDLSFSPNPHKAAFSLLIDHLTAFLAMFEMVVFRSPF